MLMGWHITNSLAHTILTMYNCGSCESPCKLKHIMKHTGTPDNSIVAQETAITET